MLFVSGTKSNPFVEQKNVFVYGTDNIETEIKISKTVFNKQKKTYSNCDFNEDDDGNFEYPSNIKKIKSTDIKSIFIC